MDFINDIQYKNTYRWSIILVLFLAISIQIIIIVQKLEMKDLALLDYYILNGRSNNMIETLVGWLLPVIIGLLCAKQFSYFKDMKNAIFMRMNRKKFILIRAANSFLLAYLFVLFFYLACFIFTLIIMLVINPNIYFGVSIPFSDMISVSLYFTHPLIYLLMYVNLIALFAGVFSLIGFITSLYTDNKVAIMLAPFAFALFSIIISESLPYGMMINYNKFITLSISTGYGVPNIYYGFSSHLIVFLLIFLEKKLIEYKGTSDL